jgi:hypothetical protein
MSALHPIATAKADIPILYDFISATWWVSSLNETLILKPTARHYGSPWTDADADYVVLDSGKVAGRIMLHPQTPPGHSWTITAMDKPPSVHNRGYSTTREQAMAEFKTQWLGC